ncbi:MAG: peptidoglycan-associated lipoprotein Pal [Pseudomonadales bacterium]
MTTLWSRNFLVLLLGGLIVAGCAGSGTQRLPTEPSAEPVETPDTTPPPTSTSSRLEVDENMNPYIPGTTRLMERTFYFAYDRSVLSPDDLATLEMHATFMRNNPDRSVVVEGHADERGTREYNLALGERRADSIRTFLLSSGVSSRQVEIVSYGEERPEDPGHDESAWARSRRAVLIYR